MGRRSGFNSFLKAVARESARSARESQRLARTAERQRARALKEQDRLDKMQSKLERQEYLESRMEEVEELNEELRDHVNQLKGILEHTLKIDDTISFDSLRMNEKAPVFEPPKQWDRVPPAEPSFFAKLLPGSKERYERQLKEYAEAVANDQKRFDSAKETHEFNLKTFQEKVRHRNAEVDEFRDAYLAKDRSAIETYNAMVLERSEYPDGFPQSFRVGYIPESKELVIDYELPTTEVVPAEEEFRYVKTKDEITSKPRKAKEIKDLYQEVVSGIALRSIHEVFEADQAESLAVVSFNGVITCKDRATGKEIRPCLISVRSTRDQFGGIDLRHIEKSACLRSLGAQVSSRPDELVPVKPIVEFDMVDKRFIEQSDILGELESRPNLMELTPGQFENLVSNLFEKLGLEAKLTRSSRDGGVDCVAFDNRPVLGGKVIIQAKRYKHTVGVSAVRDLYGTMQHEGANKGILVTTSGYGPDAFEFSKDKPIELIAGGHLIYLLDQVGVQARIVFPEDSVKG